MSTAICAIDKPSADPHGVAELLCPRGRKTRQRGRRGTVRPRRVAHLIATARRQGTAQNGLNHRTSPRGRRGRRPRHRRGLSLRSGTRLRSRIRKQRKRRRRRSRRPRDTRLPWRRRLETHRRKLGPRRLDKRLVQGRDQLDVHVGKASLCPQLATNGAALALPAEARAATLSLRSLRSRL